MCMYSGYLTGITFVVHYLQEAPAKCLSNLHYCVCMIHRQEAARGSIRGGDIEFWIERSCQALKGCTRRLPSNAAEKTMANHVQEIECLERAISMFPYLKATDDLVPEYRASTLDYSKDQLYDDMYVCCITFLYLSLLAGTVLGMYVHMQHGCYESNVHACLQMLGYVSHREE